MLSRVSDEAFFAMCWASHAIQSDRVEGAARFFRYPDEAVGDGPDNRLRIYPWAIETLLNELLATPKLQGAVWPIELCRSFRTMARFYDALYRLEGEEYSLLPSASKGFASLPRLSQRQFEWQRGFLSMPQLFRAAYLYGGPHCRAHFESKHGFSFDTFTYACFAIHSVLIDSPCVRLTDDLAKHGLPQSELEAVAAVISPPIGEARRLATELRATEGHTGYKISALRTYPCVRFGDLIYAPLPELVTLRGTTGIFYDIVGGPKDATKEAAAQFESYTEKLLSAMLQPMRATREYRYPYRGQQQPTPDVLVYEGEALSVICECKATRMPIGARYSESPVATDAPGYEELAKGVFQIWRFASHVRRGIVEREWMRPGACGVVITLDSWFSMSSRPLQQVFEMAQAMALKDPNLTDQDKIPVTFGYIDDVETTLSRTDPAGFLSVVRAAASAKYQGWSLFATMRDLLPELGDPRDYPFDAEIKDHVRWWMTIPPEDQP
jgi:hypothetical protein